MESAPPVTARFFAPPPQLAGSFTSFYLLTVNLAPGETITDHVHPEWGNLRIFLGDPPAVALPDASVLTGKTFLCSGPTARAIGFDMPATRMWGVGLLPLGWARFMDTGAAEMADCVVDGDTHSGFSRFAPLAQALRESVLDVEGQAALIGDYFLSIDRPVRRGAQIHAANEALVDPDVHSAADMASRAGVTQRTLERMCARYFGFTPQLLMRRQRMMRTLSAFMLSDKSSWSRMIDLHFTDHAHFTREFHAFMKMSPTEYASMPHPILSAFMVERARILGSPVQTLDQPVRVSTA